MVHKPLFLLFCFFIFLCGLTHLLSIYTIWVPIYEFEGLLKAATALASALTAVWLWPLIPTALKIPTPSAFAAKNKELEELNRHLEDRITEKVKDSERLAAIVTHSHDAIFSKDLDGHIQNWNEAAEKMFQYSRQEMVGDLIYKLVPEDRKLEEVAVLRQVALGNDVPPFESVRRRKDGSTIPVFISVSPIKDEQGNVVAASSLVQDLTERKRLNAKLKETSESLKESNLRLEKINKAKDEFIANLSHELRSPLNIITGYCQLIPNLNHDSKEFSFALQAITRSAKAQLHLVEDLLDMSRIISGKFSLAIRSANLNEIVEDSMKAVEFAASAKSIRMYKKMPTNDNVLVCDPDRIRQVLWNLLSNSVKFTDPGGEISINCSRRDGEFVFEVSDTGRGISGENLTHIFDRLWQAGDGGTSNNGGLGLGLKISRDLVAAHGGTLTAESAGIGKGATFRVQLPVKAIASEGQADTDPNERLLTGLNVLIVDDAPDALEMLRIVLESAGAKVVTAKDGAEALELIRKNNIQFIVSDINMPIMDGFSFMTKARIIEKERGREKRPAIALTARTGQGDKERAYESGYQLHLIKPVEPTLLVQKVLSVLGHKVN